MNRSTLFITSQKKKEIIDITDVVNEALHNRGNDDGLCSLFIKHTTAALTTADLDPGTDLDMLDAFEAMVPKLHYRHPHNPAHIPDHIMSSLIGASIFVPITKGSVALGTWQRIVLVELDGPRKREIVVHCL